MGNRTSGPEVPYEYTLEWLYTDIRGYNTAFFAILPKITGALSTVGSGYIIQDVLKDPRKRRRTYHRLMLGLSISDFISSFFVNFLSTWPMPKGYLKYAIGNVATCDMVGFLQVLTGFFTTPLYNCSLATYFLVQLKYNWRDGRITKMEKWLHIIPWSVGLIPAIVGLAMKAFGPITFICG